MWIIEGLGEITYRRIRIKCASKEHKNASWELWCSAEQLQNARDEKTKYVNLTTYKFSCLTPEMLLQ